MAARYFQGEIKAAPGLAAAPDRAMIETFAALSERVSEMVEALAFNRALEAIWNALDSANKYIVDTAPFTLAKDASNLPRVAQILANLLEGLRMVADTLEPFMPVTARRLLDLLAIDEATARAPFGQGLKVGHRIKPPTPLFPRIEKPEQS